MQTVGDARLICPYTADLDRIWRVGRATIDEGMSDERNDVISSGQDEVAYQPLVSIDDKVSSKLFRFFMTPGEFRG